MAESIIKLTLDTFRENRIQEPVVMQHDYNSRFIDATFTTLGVFEPISAAAEVLINAKRADGQGKSFSGEVNADGTVRVPIDQWMCALDDRVTCTISAVSAIPEQRLSTMPFTILVKASPNTTELPEEGTADADVLAEVLAGEKDRVIEEAKRRANENARKSAEEARQRAEEQRLTDEATRVANEAERVSSELSRDATFKGWAQDIASLPSFDSRISANSDRITNLEAGLPSSVWRVDDTAARVKDVPENARPKAIVNKIGGMTYKTENLIPFPYIDTTKTAGGVTFTLNADRSITFSGDATEGYEFALGVVPIKQGESYALSIAGSASNIHYQIRFIDTSGIFIGTATIESGKLNLVVTPNQIPTEAVAMSIYLKRLANDAVSGTIYPMCNKGTTAKPYSPYFEGLRSAKVTEVKSVGANLMLPLVEGTFFGVTFKKDANGVYHLSGTATTNISRLYVVNLPKREYSLTLNHSKTVGAQANNSMYIVGRSASNSWLIASYACLSNTPSIADVEINNIIFVIHKGVNVDGVTIAPMLKKGSTAKPYTPYVEHILPIPEELRPANGINENVYDYIEWAEDGSVKKTVKCGVVDLGTLDWKGSSSGGSFSAFLKDAVDMAFRGVGICSKYDVRYSNDNKSLYTTKLTSDVGCVVVDRDYTDAATFKAAMSGVMLVYELAEPEVTDTYADLIIDVEGGGTLTFENEHDYDMPNTVTYMLKEVTA